MCSITSLFFSNSSPALPYMLLFITFSLLTNPSVIPLVILSLIVFLTAWKSLLMPIINVFNDDMVVFQYLFIHLTSSTVSQPLITLQKLFNASYISENHPRDISVSKVICCDLSIFFPLIAMSITDAILFTGSSSDLLSFGFSFFSSGFQFLGLYPLCPSERYL